ncbi:MAG TPA: hypothetical protein G4N92_05285 [Anaerolineae bacterium]|nr:hypothetical protein [Anaerolineae bacterium]
MEAGKKITRRKFLTLTGALGASVDVKLAKEVVGISSYDAIVLGSAIYMSNIISDAAKFLEKFQADLKDKPTAYFIVCLTMKEDTNVNRETVSSWLQPARDLVQPVGEGLFAGVLDFNKLSPLYHLIMKGMKETEGDYRDWGAIRAWTSEIQPALIYHD